jgi:hypothetical protein
MKCRLKNRSVIMDRYVHGKLSREEREAFDEHAFTCEHCSRDLMFHAETAELIRKEGHEVFTDYLEKSKRKSKSRGRHWLESLGGFFTGNPWRPAIAGIGIAVIILAISMIRPVSDPSNKYETLPYLEGMIGNVSRSESITILSPGVGETVRANPSFKWEGTEGETIYLVVLDHLGNERFALMTDSSEVRLPKRLSPGLYYWKLESAEDLLYLGKFVVRR